MLKRACSFCHLHSPLAQECRESPDSQLAPWGTMERLSPLLYTWAQARCQGQGSTLLWECLQASGRQPQQLCSCHGSAVQLSVLVAGYVLMLIP